MYDESCDTLARKFLEDGASEEDVKSLAQHIQDEVESWLSDHEPEGV